MENQWIINYYVVLLSTIIVLLSVDNKEHQAKLNYVVTSLSAHDLNDRPIVF